MESANDPYNVPIKDLGGKAHGYSKSACQMAASQRDLHQCCGCVLPTGVIAYMWAEPTI